jgi:hypothetical protein
MRTLIAHLMMSAPAWGQTCTIVTNGALHVFQHELAHCNGWTHAPFEAGVDPPDNYVHEYDGELVVYLTGENYDGQMDTMSFAQIEAHFIMAWDRTVPALCMAFWKERGIYAASEKVSKIVGCSIK